MTPNRWRAGSTRGQAMVEYALIVTLLMVGTVVGFVGWPFTRRLFEALQSYVDLYFYALNIAVG
jgi:Flp pilus assembly pilin Flp